MKRVGLLLVIIVGIAFPLHLVWEYLQCGPFFVHEALPPTHQAMLVATAGDVVLTVVAYAVVAGVSWNAFWPLGTWNFGQWIMLEFAALTEAMTIEWLGLTMGRWSYSDIAPTLPGTDLSLLPILQLTVLFPITFAVAARVFRRLSHDWLLVRRS